MNTIRTTWSICIFALLACVSIDSRAVVLQIAPDATTVTVGSSLQVALEISQVVDGGSPSLATYDIDLRFDSSVLSFSGVTFGDPLAGDQLDLFGLGAIANHTASPDSINVFELSLDAETDLNSQQLGAFTLVTLSFSVIAPGASTLQLNVNALGDASAAPLEFELNPAVVTVTAVPEPRTALILLLGMTFLLAVKAVRSNPSW